MKVTTETLEDSQIALNIEVEANEFGEAMDGAYHRLVNKMSVPGFRKGKAPRFVLEQHIGKGALLEEALTELIPRLYKEAVALQKIEPIEQPQIEIIQNEPVIFKATVPVKPTVKLGDYHNLKIATEPVKVTKQEIDYAIELKRQEQAVFSPVKRSVQFGDLVTMNIEANIEGKPFLNHKDVVYEVNKDSAVPLPGFAQNLTQTRKNKEKVFNLNVPADYRVKEFAGKECFFKVLITEIKEKQLPELDDEFAQTIGYDNLNSMRKKITADLRVKAKQINQQKLRGRVVDTVVEMSEACYPPVLVDNETDKILENEARRLGFTKFSDYLNATEQTEEKLREELRPIAQKQVARSLVLDEIAKLEKIEISDSKVDNQIKKIVKDEGKGAERMRELLQLPQVRESIQQILCREKTVDWLVKIATSDTKDEVEEK
jgi:trigger factor